MRQTLRVMVETSSPRFLAAWRSYPPPRRQPGSADRSFPLVSRPDERSRNEGHHVSSTKTGFRCPRDPVRHDGQTRVVTQFCPKRSTLPHHRSTLQFLGLALRPPSVRVASRPISHRPAGPRRSIGHVYGVPFRSGARTEICSAPSPLSPRIRQSKKSIFIERSQSAIP
jgi:hypothetical protein